MRGLERPVAVGEQDDIHRFERIEGREASDAVTGSSLVNNTRTRIPRPLCRGIRRAVVADHEVIYQRLRAIPQGQQFPNDLADVVGLVSRRHDRANRQVPVHAKSAASPRAFSRGSFPDR